MESKWSKLAVAAAVVLAVAFGLNMIGGRHMGGVAWSQLLENVQHVRTSIHRTRMTIARDNEPDSTVEFLIYRSTELGIRRDAYADGELATQLYVSRDAEKCVEVIPSQRRYVKAKFTEQQLAEIREKNDPRELVKLLVSFEHTELGTEMIEGRECEGIEVDDPRFGRMIFEQGKGRLWADVETDLPVRIEFEGTSAGGAIRTRLVVDQFNWDPVLTPADFEPNIPEDYTVMAEVDLSANEETVVEGLRIFAGITGGKYPSSLDLMTSMQEVQYAFIIERRKRGVSIEQEPTKDEMSSILAIQGVCMFYAGLMNEDKDVAYYGDKVSAEHPHAVLMRWKCCEDQYRVIMGDLTTRDATAEELAELEALPLNTESNAVDPEPADGTIGTAVDGMQLKWLPGATALEHKIYLGTEPDNLTLLATVKEAQFSDLPVLERGTAYLWRVDEVNADGSVTTGDLWSFGTGKLVGWWKLDETEGAVAADSSGAGHAGTLVGDPAWAPGAIGGALELDGDGDYVDLGTAPDFDAASQITVAAWVKVASFDMDWQAIVTKGDTAWRLSRSMDDNLHFACTGMWPEWVHGSADVNDGQWHHVAGVYDGAELRLYVDGGP
ncbi:MAG: hypothetical protein JW741_21470 [Sedimentisphaerales bacterium]|nr:hypothetical protein [Sedimentisphaerales bacterium]